MAADVPPIKQTALGSYIAQAAAGGTATINVYQGIPPGQVERQTLEDDRELLESLPLDRLPDPAPLPPGSFVPHVRNPLFVGRAPDLLKLAAPLKSGQATAAVGQVAAFTGLGGIGKTQLAVEFARRYGQFFGGGVFWISLERAEDVPAQVALCGGPQGLDARQDFASLKLEDQVALVLGHWQSARPKLLIFDNCEDPHLLATWRPRAGGCRVLVTSRVGEWEAALGVQALALGVLSREESLELLRKFRPGLPPDDPALDDLAAELGDLPLALHLAGSYLEKYRHSPLGAPGALLAALRQPDLLNHPALAGAGGDYQPTGHDRHVGRTFAVSYERLKTDDAVDVLARRALRHAAQLAPGEPLPRYLLKLTLGEGDEPETEQAREEAVLRLVSLGLLESDAEGALRLHRLLAKFVQATDAEVSDAEAVEAALFAEATRINRAGLPAPLLQWQAHLRYVAERAAESEREQAGNLLNELGYHLNMIGDYSGARAMYERALKIDEAAFGPDHPNVAIRVNNLGSVLHDQGDLAGARAALERTLTIFERVYGPDHPHTRTVRANLASLDAQEKQ